MAPMKIGLGLGLAYGGTKAGFKTFDLSSALPTGATFTRASSGTRVNSSGLIVTETTNVPRWDFDPDTLASKGLMLEPASTNICLQSSDFSNNTAWPKSLATVSANAVVSPTGATDADTVTLHAASYDLYQPFIGLTPGDAYTFSVYVKLGTATNFVVVPNDSTTFDSLISINGVFTAADGLNTSTWKRVSLTMFVPSTGKINIHIGGHAKTGVTQQTAGTVHLWGAQMEKTIVPTSYIATTAASATRAVDVLSLPVDDAPYTTILTDYAGSRTTYRELVGGVIGTRNSLYRLSQVQLKRTSATTLEPEALTYAQAVMAKGGDELSDMEYTRISALITALKGQSYDGTTLYNRVAIYPLKTGQNVCAHNAPPWLSKIGGLSVSTSFTALRGLWSFGARGYRNFKDSPQVDHLFFSVGYNASRERMALVMSDQESTTTNNARIHWGIPDNLNLNGQTINPAISYNIGGATTGVAPQLGSDADLNYPSSFGIALGNGDGTINRYSFKRGDFTSGTKAVSAGTVIFDLTIGQGSADACNYPVLAFIDGPKSQAIMDTLTGILYDTVLNDGLGALAVGLYEGQSNLSGTYYSLSLTSMAAAYTGFRAGAQQLSGGTMITLIVTGTGGSYSLTTTGQDKIDVDTAFLATSSKANNPSFCISHRGESDSETLSDSTEFGPRLGFWRDQQRTQQTLPNLNLLASKTHFSLSAGGWGDPASAIFTQARRNYVEICRKSLQTMVDADTRSYAIETYGLPRCMDDPGDPLYNPADNVHWNLTTCTYMAAAETAISLHVDFLATKPVAVRKWAAAILATGETVTDLHISNIEIFFSTISSYSARIARIVNPLYTQTRAKHMDVSTNLYVDNIPASGKITVYLMDTVSGGDAATINAALLALTGSSSNATLQHSLTSSGATSTDANGTFLLKSSHTTTTGSILYTGGIWVKSGDNDCVLAPAGAVRDGATLTAWQIEKHGTGVLYTHPQSVGTSVIGFRPPSVTAWAVGAAGSGTVPTVVETMA